MDNWVLNTPLQFWKRDKGASLTHSVLFRFFESQRNVVVLANGNQAEKEVNVLKCESENIPVIRRKGGGGTVVLGEGCLILTFAFLAEDLFGNSRYFQIINDLWIGALLEAGLNGIAQNGISDIVAGNKKIAGTSIFRKKHLLVYQGSLLVDPDFEKIFSLLKHPSKEPDYRKGRTHSDFLTSTRALGLNMTTEELGAHCTRYFNENALGNLRDHFVDPKIFFGGGSFWK